MLLGEEAEVCVEAGDADAATALAEQVQPDVCLVGFDIPGGALAAVQGITAVAPDAAVIVMDSGQDVDDMLAAVRAGAIGYLPASIERDALLRVIRAVLTGEAALPRSMVGDLARELRAATISSADGLTPREGQVLAMLRRGQSTAAIADRLGISPVTVRRHISTLVQKIGVEDRASLARPPDDHTSRPER
jgi:DNA-binding NarL/FixJ family response regulator